MILFSEADQSMLTLQQISNREGLSLPYAAKLLMKLKGAGLVRALRGRNGGFVLSRPAESIYLNEILSALGDSLYGSHHCDRYSVDKDTCRHSGNCRVGSIWGYFNQQIQTVLGEITLADVAEGKIKFPKVTNIKM
jgi:Rrf2 family protein